MRVLQSNAAEAKMTQFYRKVADQSQKFSRAKFFDATPRGFLKPDKAYDIRQGNTKTA